MADETENIKSMNKSQRLCWHYVMDIHDPEHYWYSLGLGKSFKSKIELLDHLHSL